MKTYKVSQRTVPLDDLWDVIVIGGGPAGCAAAYSAAREGARTLLIEATGCLGGMSTAGMVPGWCGFSDKEKFIHEGFAAKIRVALYTEEQNKPDKWLSIDFEHLKRVYDELMMSVGVTVLFQTVLGGVEMKNDHTIDTILTVNKDGITAKNARVYIDCTGDGDVAAWAGAPFEKGDTEGDLMPVSHCFAITNVNEQVFDGPKYEDWTKRAIVDESLPLIKDGFFGRGTSLGKRTFAYNAGHIWDIDASDAQSLSKGLIDGRKLAAQLHEALKRYYVNGFNDSFLTATGSLLGVRETRRIIGDYVLTKEDHQARRSFPDEIARNSFFIDIHASIKEVQEQQRGNPVVQLRKKRTSFGPGESHGIPYRCLTPKGLTNCIVAGRAISCDRETFGAIRIMPACFSMGEAAGIAAVFAQNSTPVDVHTIDVQKLRSRLREVGAYLPR